MTASSLIRTLTGLIVTGVFLWLIARRVDFSLLQKSFSNVDYFWLVLAINFYGMEYVFRIYRWKAMLVTKRSTLSWRRCSSPLLLSYAINAVLPFRAGDIVRCYAFNKRLEIGSGILLATVFVERLLDFLVVLVLFAVALWFFDVSSIPFLDLGGVSVLAISAVLVAVLFFPRLLSPFTLLVEKLGSFLPAKREAKYLVGVRSGIETLEDLSQKGTMVRLVGYSVVIWIIEGCIFLFVAKSLPALDYPIGALLALPVGTFATLIPSTPGYVGTFDYFVAVTLEMLGNTAAASLAFAMIIHSVLLGPLVALGATYLFLKARGQWKV